MATDYQPRAEATVRAEVRKLKAMRDALPSDDLRRPVFDVVIGALEWARGAHDLPPHVAAAEGADADASEG